MPLAGAPLVRLHAGTTSPAAVVTPAFRNVRRDEEEILLPITLSCSVWQERRYAAGVNTS